MLQLPQPLYQQIILHCQKGYPLEACGLLAGKDGEVGKVYQMKNADRSAVSYSMDSKELFGVMKSIRQEGLQMVGIFHSHVASEAYPSQTDVKLAFYPDVPYVIISLKDREHPLAKGYRIVEGRITKEALRVV